MSVKVGKLACVKLGTYTIAEQGTWSIGGMSNEMLDSTTFLNEEKTFEFGVADYGTISFNGFWDMTDTNGQVLLQSAFKNKSKITNALKFYVDNTSYYTVDVTNNSESAFLMQNVAISYDKSSIGTISFQAKVSGLLTLV